MASLISQAQGRVIIFSYSCNCPLRPSDKWCSPAPQNEVTRSANRPLLVHHWHNPSSPARRCAFVSSQTWRLKYCTHGSNQHTHNKLETLRHVAKGWKVPTFRCYYYTSTASDIFLKQVIWEICRAVALGKCANSEASWQIKEMERSSFRSC